MANDTFISGGTPSAGNPSTSNNAVTIVWLAQTSADITTTTTNEAQAQVKQLACTMNKVRVVLSTVTSGATGNVGIRKNAVAGNTFITTTVTGEFEDTTHSDSFSSGDLFAWYFQCNINGDSVNGVGPMGCHVSGTSNEVYTPQVSAGGWQYSGTSAAFPYLGGRMGIFAITPETNAQVKQRAAGTWSNNRHNVSSNSNSAASVVLTFRKNAANGNQVVTYAASATGIMEDTTHTDATVSGDLTCNQIISTSSTGATVFQNDTNIFSPSAHLFDTLNTMGSENTVNGGNSFHIIGGGNNSSGNTTEANAQQRFRFSTRVANFRGNMLNNFSSTGTSSIRDNGVTGNSSFTPTASSTGYFEDSTHHDDIASGDLINTLTTATTSLGWQIQFQATFGLATNAAAIGTIFGQFSQTLNATNQDASHIAMQFGGISQAVAVDVEATNHGPITTLFGLFGQAVNATDLGAGTSGIRQFWTF